MYDKIRFIPAAGSPILKSEFADELLPEFEDGCRKILLKELTVSDVVSKLTDIDKSLKKARVTRDVGETVDAVQRMSGIIPDLDTENLEDDLVAKVENVKQIRESATLLFLGVLRQLLRHPQLALKMKPREFAEWFKLVREEEDRERKLILAANAEMRENAKLRLLFFKTMAGSLSPSDIDLLSDDIKEDVKCLMDGGKLRYDTDGVQEAPFIG